MGVDVDGDRLTYAVVGDKPEGLTFNADGSFSFVPAEADQALDTGETRVVTFEYVANDGTVNSAAKTVTITINGVNDAPVAAAASAAGTEDDAAVTGQVSATDVDVEALTYAVVGDKPEGLTFNADGSFSFVPAEADQALDTGETRVVTFEYVANDGTVNSAAKTVTITINGVNDAPVAAAASAAGTEDDAAITGQVSATDVDLEALTYAVVGEPPAGLTFNADGSFSFAPAEADQALDTGETRVVTFEYVANDGTVNSAAKMVTITINGVNDAPALTGAPSVIAGVEDDWLDITAAQLLAGYSDVDGEALSVVEPTADRAGVRSNPDGSFTLAPEADYNGPIVLSYGVSDGTVVTPAQISIDFAPVNDLAVITGTATATIVETNEPQATAGQLAATDIDSPATFVAQTGVTGSNGYGTFAIDAAGAWTYTMNDAHDELVGGEDYSDSFTVTTADGTEQTVTVTLLGSDEPLDAADDADFETVQVFDLAGADFRYVDYPTISHNVELLNVSAGDSLYISGDGSNYSFSVPNSSDLLITYADAATGVINQTRVVGIATGLDPFTLGPSANDVNEALGFAFIQADSGMGGNGGGGGGASQGFSLDVDSDGNLGTATSFSAALQAVRYTDDGLVGSNALIDGFGPDDLITVSNWNLDDAAFTSDGSDLEITFRSAEGAVSQIVLTGLVDPSYFVNDLASATAAAGFDFIESGDAAPVGAGGSLDTDGDGNLDTAQAFIAAGGDFTYTDDAAVASNATISGFDAGDRIVVANAPTSAYTFASEGLDLTIRYENPVTQVVNEIRLAGITGGVSIGSEAEAEALLDADFFQSAQSAQDASLDALDDDGNPATFNTVDASSGAFRFADDVATASSTRIVGFGLDDQIDFSGISADDLNVTLYGDDLELTYTNSAGVVSTIVLAELQLANPEAFVFNVDSAQSAVGYSFLNFFPYVG